MKQSITLYIYQRDAARPNAKLSEFDYVGYGYEPVDPDGRVKIGEVTCEVDSASSETLQKVQLAALRKKLGTAVAGVTAIERQIQNLLAIENATEVTS